MCLTSTNLLHPSRLSLFCPPASIWPRHPTTAAPSPSPTAPLLSSPSHLYIIVTVQIYLSRSTKPTGSKSSPAASAVSARSAANPQHTSESCKASVPAKKGGGAKVSTVRKAPNFSLQLRKSGSLSSYAPLDTPSYCSPIKSPSQYFQICY